MRLNPVAPEIIPHQASEDIVVDGVLIEKGSTLYGSVGAVFANPENFPEPEKFIPDRFMKNGEYVHDLRVCSFSVGLRYCIGKQIAIEEQFIFATNIVREFRLVRTSGNMDIAEDLSMRFPKHSMMRFERRRSN
ncbi:Oidioi.mRNA.OKI2018_I69.PAR.g13123.t1.cds [Oikopleura dioica]|uniref:Oidioi.mRNA.OKI2018_I69.PAR.g13123.t1.cds n=1 Tax=Oikopleura dioica TaxID=34765 RepID=A0ABN7S6Q2_OIKDI|nr:Oidioi.mRNA.OKI2018_I69.PAR.g13123.t1.cds [Oikopleura dioica]